MTALVVALSVAALLALLIEVYLRRQRREADERQEWLWEETQAKIRENIESPARVANLIDVRDRLGAQEAYLDMICRSVAAALKSNRAVVTLVDGERQQWIASHFVDEEEAKQPRNDDVPYDRSYCMFVVASDHTFVVENAAKDDRVATHPCTTVLGMRAYLGTPVHSKEGFPVGSLCVFDVVPRKWTRRDIVTLESFAALVSL